MTPPDTLSPSAKTLFGNYEIVDTTGSGGMGVVYRAIDMQFGRPVALKILRDDLRAQEHIVARFQREAEAIATLNHPNIVHVYSVGRVGKIPYLAMEYIEGTTLGNLLVERGALPWPEAIAIGMQVAEALGSAHERGIIHRDIKPGNILLDHAGKAYVTDFGIAKVLSATTKLTVDGSRLGTPQYMSPERCKNKESTPASDIYSLGVLLYQAISGRLPYEAATPVELIAKITGEDPVRISEYVPDIPESVERLLAHMLDPNPKHRPQSARELIALMERVRDGKPLDDMGDQVLESIRRQLDAEPLIRTRAPGSNHDHKTKSPVVPIAVRISRGWFQLSRAARLALAGGGLLAASGLAVFGAWELVQFTQPVATFRGPTLTADAWNTPLQLASLTPESFGVRRVRFDLPEFRAARITLPVGSPSALVEFRGAPFGPNAGQYALAQVGLDGTAPELVLAPTPLGEGDTQLLAAVGGSINGTLLFAHRARTSVEGQPVPVPSNTVAAQPVGNSGRWLVVRMQAGQWLLEAISPQGQTEFSLPLTAGPVNALAVSPDGLSAALVALAGSGEVLLSIALSPGAVASEVARGDIALSPQSFAADGQRFVASVQSKDDGPREILLAVAGGSEPVVVGQGDYAAFAGDEDKILYLAQDRATRAQLWRMDSAGEQQEQLTFLGAGLGDSFAVTPEGKALAPIADQPALLIVEPAS